MKLAGSQSVATKLVDEASAEFEALMGEYRPLDLEPDRDTPRSENRSKAEGSQACQ